MDVFWTDRAKAQLRLIHNYIAEDSPKKALQVIDRLTIRSEQLQQFSHSGRKVPEYNHQDIRELLEKPYRIIYITRAKQVDVLTILHSRQLLPWNIEQL